MMHYSSTDQQLMGIQIRVYNCCRNLIFWIPLFFYWHYYVRKWNFIASYKLDSTLWYIFTKFRLLSCPIILNEDCSMHVRSILARQFSRIQKYLRVTFPGQTILYLLIYLFIFQIYFRNQKNKLHALYRSSKFSSKS